MIALFVPSEERGSGLDREIVGWPAEFQVIMWEAVAAVANSRASQLRQGDRI